MSTERKCTPKTLCGTIRNWILLLMGNEGENKVRRREGRATEQAQSEMPLEIRDGFASVVSIQQLFASVLNLTVYLNAVKRSTKMKLSDNPNILIVHFLYDDLNSHLWSIGILWA